MSYCHHFFNNISEQYTTLATGISNLLVTKQMLKKDKVI